MSREATRYFVFGPYRLDPAEHRLSRGGEVVPLTPKAFDVLRVLIESGGRLVEKDSLLQAIWPDSFVEEGNLNRLVSVLRKTLREGPADEPYIETVPKRGYRFVAAVTEGVEESAGPARAAVREVRIGWSIRAALAGAAIIAVAGTGIAWRHPSTGFATPTVPRHHQVTFTGRESYPALSPDGRLIAYVTAGPRPQVTVQDMTSGQTMAIFSAEEAGHPRWSPDGAELLFYARDGRRAGIFTIPRIGGSARHVARDRYVACWSPDGSIVAVGSYLGGLVTLVNRETGLTRTLALGGERRSIWDLDWSPVNGRLLVVSDDAHGRFEAVVVQPDGSGQRRVAAPGSEIESARWAPDGRAMYFVRRVDQTATLFKVGLGADAAPDAVMTGLDTGAGSAISADGRHFIYGRAPAYSNLWLVEPDPMDPAHPAVKELTHGTSIVERPSVSPDGTTIAFSSGHASHANIYTMPIAGGGQASLTALNAISVGAAWAPDGRRVAFASTEGGSPHVWLADRTGTPLRAVSTADMSDSLSLTWGAGGRILYQQPGNKDFYVLDPDRPGREPLLLGGNGDGWISSPVFSPDGRRIAIDWNRSPRPGIWTLGSDGTGPQLLYPRRTPRSMTVPIGWAADGRAVFVLEGSNGPSRGMLAPNGETITGATIVSVPLNGGAAKPLAALPFDEVGGIAVTPDGRRLVCVVYSSRTDVWMVDDFDATVARRSWMPGLLFLLH